MIMLWAYTCTSLYPSTALSDIGLSLNNSSTNHQPKESVYSGIVSSNTVDDVLHFRVHCVCWLYISGQIIFSLYDAKIIQVKKIKMILFYSSIEYEKISANLSNRSSHTTDKHFFHTSSHKTNNWNFEYQQLT